MRPVRDRVIAAAAEFVTSSNPQDEIFGLVFNDEVQPVLRGQPFTSDAGVLREALTEVFHPEGRTALYDAVARGLAYVANGTSERRVLVVLSDGGDNASDANLKDVMTLVQTSVLTSLHLLRWRSRIHWTWTRNQKRLLAVRRCQRRQNRSRRKTSTKCGARFRRSRVMCAIATPSVTSRRMPRRGRAFTRFAST